jgi:hypothetical protein
MMTPPPFTFVLTFTPITSLRRPAAGGTHPREALRLGLGE